MYEADALTDRSDRFMAAEIIREKLFRLTGDELPYTSTVIIDKYEEEGNLRRVAATIVVERDGHKGMIIGEKGEKLKRIGTEARHELETLTGGKVFLLSPEECCQIGSGSWQFRSNRSGRKAIQGKETEQ
jgi:GTP-binding protein Era